MGLTVAAIGIVAAISVCWLVVARHALADRLAWRRMLVPFALGALSPVPILLLHRMGDGFSLPAAPDLADAFVIALGVAAVPEELLKAVAVVGSFLLLRQVTDKGPCVDGSTGFRIPVLCGLGFAAVENIVYSVNSSLIATIGAGIGHPLLIPLLRSVAAGLLHASLGCLMGFFFANFASGERLRWRSALAGCVAAIVGHLAVDWGLIVPVLTMLQNGAEPDGVALAALAPHFLLALFLIPSVILAAGASIVVMRRRLRVEALYLSQAGGGADAAAGEKS